MKLFLLSEADEELRRLSRIAYMNPSDANAMGRALRAHQRSRGSGEREAPRVEKQTQKLRSHGKGWSHRPLLPVLTFTIDWEGDITRNEALATGLKILYDRGAEVGDWDIFQEDEEEKWMVLNIEVSEDLVQHLMNVYQIEWSADVGRGTGYPRVTISADWV